MLRRCRPLLGTFVEITAESADIIDAGFATLARVHALMSAHEPDSELSRINRFAHRDPVELSPETSEVLKRSLRWWRLSDGQFDVAAAGARSLAEGRIPRHVDQPAPEKMTSDCVVLDNHRVRLVAQACLDLGGIAKGYAVDRSVEAMRGVGARRGLVNAGGDLFAFGDRPWTVTVLDPMTRQPAVEVELCNEALATSACIDGSSAHLPFGTGWASVTVRAPSTCDADALTKIAWAGRPNVGDLLDRAQAIAFGIRPDGGVEVIGKQKLAA